MIRPHNGSDSGVANVVDPAPIKFLLCFDVLAVDRIRKVKCESCTKSIQHYRQPNRAPHHALPNNMHSALAGTAKPIPPSGPLVL